MKVEMLKQTSYKGVSRMKGSVHDILDETGGGDSTALRWIERGIAKTTSNDPGRIPEPDPLISIHVKKPKVEK